MRPTASESHQESELTGQIRWADVHRQRRVDLVDPVARYVMCRAVDVNSWKEIALTKQDYF